MHVFKTIASLKNYLAAAKSEGKETGFVPTMGALHQGHLQLLQQSLQDNDLTVCSIYVNPAQFNNPDDLARYPRHPEQDLALLEEAGCHVVFLPADEEMYPEGKPGLSIDFGELEKVLEGRFRPGHFSGVGIILAKLFHAVAPQRVYFGQKDLQQVAVVQKLIGELFFELQLVRVPTVRNTQGLALSSRNSRLSEKGRTLAARLFQAITLVKNTLERKEASVTKALSRGKALLSEEKKIEVEYLEVVDAAKFGIVSDTDHHQEIAVCVAAYVEGVRLIDNVLWEVKPV